MYHYYHNRMLVTHLERTGSHSFGSIRMPTSVCEPAAWSSELRTDFAIRFTVVVWDEDSSGFIEPAHIYLISISCRHCWPNGIKYGNLPLLIQGQAQAHVVLLFSDRARFRFQQCGVSFRALMSLFRVWLRRADADVEFDQASECSCRYSLSFEQFLGVQ